VIRGGAQRSEPAVGDAHHRRRAADLLEDRAEIARDRAESIIVGRRRVVADEEEAAAGRQDARDPSSVARDPLRRRALDERLPAGDDQDRGRPRADARERDAPEERAGLGDDHGNPSIARRSRLHHMIRSWTGRSRKAGRTALDEGRAVVPERDAQARSGGGDGAADQAVVALAVTDLQRRAGESLRGSPSPVSRALS